MEIKNLASVCWNTAGRSSRKSSWGTEELKALRRIGLGKRKGECEEMQEFRVSALLSRWTSQQPAQGVATWAPAGDCDSAPSWPI